MVKEKTSKDILNVIRKIALFLELVLGIEIKEIKEWEMFN